MIAPRRPPPAYSSDRSSSAPPRPSDWWRGRTTSSDSPHTPSRSMASAAPITLPSSSATHAPPGSVSSRWAKRTSGEFGGGGGEGGEWKRASRSMNVTTETSWTARESSMRIGRIVGTAATVRDGPRLSVLALDLRWEGGNGRDERRHRQLLGLPRRKLVRGCRHRRRLLGLARRHLPGGTGLPGLARRHLPGRTRLRGLARGRLPGGNRPRRLAR